MATLVTEIEARAGRTMSPEEIFAISSAREQALSRLLVAVFAVNPGMTFAQPSTGELAKRAA